MPNFDRISVMKEVAASPNGKSIPVVIRADANAAHRDVRAVMDTCVAAGLRRVKFGALKDG